MLPSVQRLGFEILPTRGRMTLWCWNRQANFCRQHSSALLHKKCEERTHNRHPKLTHHKGAAVAAGGGGGVGRRLRLHT